MNGMDARTGKPLGGEAHLRQSVADVLSTPIGSRVARRDYGSLLPELLDQPMNALGRMRLVAATALALSRWERRLRVSAIAVDARADGRVSLTIDATRTDLPAPNARARLIVPLAPRPA